MKAIIMDVARCSIGSGVGKCHKNDNEVIVNVNAQLCMVKHKI